LFPAILDFLKQEDADIVLLQEAHDSQDPKTLDRQRSMEILKRHLNYPYQDFVQALILDEPEGKIPFGNAILSKLPIQQTSSRFLVEPTRAEYQDIAKDWPILPRVMQHARLDTLAGEVNVYNIHGVWDLQGDRYSPERRRMGEIVIEETSGKPNVILAGDSNASQGNPFMADLDKQLKNVFGKELKSTFNMKRKDKPGYATAAVDIMFVSPSLKVVSKKCPDVDISDHLPLVAELDIA